MNLEIHEILPVLSGVRKVGDGWQARCPSHNDLNPSLSLNEKNGRALIYCHAGCSFQDILATLGFWAKAGEKASNNYPHHGEGSKPAVRRRADEAELTGVVSKKQISCKRLAAEYDYTDEAGCLLYQIIRIERTFVDGTKDKTFSARRRPIGDESPSIDGWVYSMKGIPLVPYNLAAVEDAALVYIVEGEKDVDSLKRHSLTGSCNPFGAGKWRDEFNEKFRGKVVAILPDNDEPGRAHSEKVAKALFGVAKEILVINLPGLPEKGDVTNFFESGATPDDLMDLIERAEAWCPPSAPNESSIASKFVFTTLNTLLEEPPEDVSFVWENTLPSGGFSICSAKPKVGKSTLARNLAIAVATGSPFLGRVTKQGRVLYLCLEEKRSEIRNHFEKMGVTSDNVLIYTGSTPKEALLELAAAIAEFNPVLVIIDPLSRVLRVPDFNDYGSMARGLEPLIDLARRSGCHILALHHDSKMDRSGGDALLGSTALFGAVDCHIQLKKRDKGRTILTTQRYGEDMPETVIELDKVTGLVSALGDLQTLNQENAKVAIIESMGDNEALDESEIKTRVEGYSKGVLSKAIRALVDEGKLGRSGEGKRGNPYIYSKESTWMN